MILGENGRAGSVASIKVGLGFARTNTKKTISEIKLAVFPCMCHVFLVNTPSLFPNLSGTKHFFVGAHLWGIHPFK